jgi:hypothetical protein
MESKYHQGGVIDMTYKLEGNLLEVCTCKAICPCWVGIAIVV